MCDESEARELVERFFEKCHCMVAEWLCNKGDKSYICFEIMCDHPIGKVIRSNGTVDTTNYAILYFTRDIGEVTDIGFRLQTPCPTFHDGHWIFESIINGDPIKL